MELLHSVILHLTGIPKEKQNKHGAHKIWSSAFEQDTETIFFKA